MTEHHGPSLVPTSACPSADCWKNICRGDMPVTESAALLRHASRCDVCGPLLLAAQISDAEETAEERAFLDALPSSSKAGQQELLSKLVPARVLPFRSKRLGGWLAAAAAVALVLGTLATWKLRVDGGNPDAHLLAVAYDRQRPSELRLPGGHAVALASPTRGAGEAAPSSELLEARLRVQKRFEQSPNDARVRQAMGEVDLVEHKAEDARRSFEMAQALNPKLPGLSFDLGAAYFELAENSPNPLDYARAIEFFSQHLQQVHGQDAIALYNRGLCWERQSVFSEAIQDYKAALALEKDAGWRQEMQRHLDRLTALASRDSAPEAQPEALTAALFLAQQDDQPGQYERFLDAASRNWLGDAKAGTAVERLAQAGESHGDLWLRDMLAQPPSASSLQAHHTLGQAITAGARGDVPALLTASSSAAALYRQAGNEPGLLRAQVEHVYGLQRGGQSEPCLAESKPLLASPRIARYNWLHAYLYLEAASCHFLHGDIAAQIADIEHARDLARSANLPVLALRADGFVVEDEIPRNHLRGAWTLAAAGLGQASSIQGSFMRRYQFLYNMGAIADSMDLPWTRVGLADAAAQAAVAAGNLQIAAYAQEELAVDQSRVGETSRALAGFAAADASLARLGTGEAVNLYRADWEAQRAPLLARQQGTSLLATRFATLEPRFKNLKAYFSRTDFYTEYAELLRESHDLPQSLEKAWQAVGGSETLLATIHTEQDRHAWQESSGRAYRILVQDLAESGSSKEALRAWQWWQAAPFRAGVAASGGHDAASLPRMLLSSPGTLTIVFARVEDGYLAWSISSDRHEPVTMHTLTTSPTAMENTAAAFVRLCADRNSSTQDLSLLGAKLYDDLFAPFEGQLKNTQSLQLDVDPSLSSIPFAALTHSGQFLGLERSILLLQPGWTAHGTSMEDGLTATPRVLVVRETVSSQTAQIPMEYDESPVIAGQFPQARVEKAALFRSGSGLTFSGESTLGQELGRADIVHYTGHGLEETAKTDMAVARPVLLGPGSLPRCRLAVLAACRSFAERKESTEDVPSFARIFLTAGAGNVLASQWDVDSRTTRQLMVRFYAELTNRRTFPQALRLAQQSLQQDRTSSHPYFWSAFQLVGRPNIVLRGNNDASF